MNFTRRESKLVEFQYKYQTLNRKQKKKILKASYNNLRILMRNLFLITQPPFHVLKGQLYILVCQINLFIFPFHCLYVLNLYVLKVEINLDFPRPHLVMTNYDRCVSFFHFPIILGQVKSHTYIYMCVTLIYM